jgi:hypothetical protein
MSGDPCISANLAIDEWCGLCREKLVLDALARSEQARQDMEIERDAAQDQCAGAERFGREQELRAVTAEQARQEAEQRASYEERRANTLRDERNKCTEAARLNGTADVAALRAERERLREAMQRIGNAHYALKTAELVMSGGVPVVYGGRSGAEQTALNDAIVAALASTPPSQEPT